ncbi:thioesterase-like superfamily-domain-containing protein [Hyaloraphidium curvatum]|nr:thioesterase-like superfamily-domain-containing protein [Hyaloraphidium curvatum]
MESVQDASAPPRTFDELFELRPLGPNDGDSLAFRAVAPRELIGQNNGMYGGFLLALATRAALKVANGRGYPHLMSMQLDVMVAVPPGDVDINVTILRASRRLLFIRMDATIVAKNTVALLAQASCGHLVQPSPLGGVAPRLIGRYGLEPSTSAAPSLVSYDAGVGSSSHVTSKALGLPKPRDWQGARYMRLTHSKEAVEYIRGVIAQGPEAVRRESWEAVDAMPRLIEHPDGKGVDETYAAFCADHFPLSTILHMALGPNIPSVTTSISFQFYKPIPAGTRHMFMISDMPAEDMPRDAVEGGSWPKETPSVAYSEARLYLPNGELVAFMRQTRLVLGPEMPAAMGRELEAIWKGKRAKL